MALVVLAVPAVQLQEGVQGDAPLHLRMVDRPDEVAGLQGPKKGDPALVEGVQYALSRTLMKLLPEPCSQQLVPVSSVNTGLPIS